MKNTQGSHVTSLLVCRKSIIILSNYLAKSCFVLGLASQKESWDYTKNTLTTPTDHLNPCGLFSLTSKSYSFSSKNRRSHVNGAKLQRAHPLTSHCSQKTRKERHLSKKSKAKVRRSNSYLGFLIFPTNGVVLLLIIESNQLAKKINITQALHQVLGLH